MSNPIVLKTVASHRIGSQSLRLSLSLQMLMENTWLFLVLLTSCQSGSWEPFLGFDCSSLVSVAVMKSGSGAFQDVHRQELCPAVLQQHRFCPADQEKGSCESKKVFFFFSLSKETFSRADSLLDKKKKMRSIGFAVN